MTEQKEYHKHSVSGIIPVLTENCIISYSALGKTIQIHKADTFEVIKTWEAHDKEITKVIYSSVYKLIISSSKDKTIKWWNIQ